MALRVTTRRQFPTNLNLSELKTFPEATQEALDAIMIAKAASEGTLDDVAQLAMGIRSNAAITKPVEEMASMITDIYKQLASLKRQARQPAVEGDTDTTV